MRREIAPGMREWLGEPAFTVAGRRYEWLDVVLAASIRGAWWRVEGAVRQGLACARRLEADEAAEVDDQAVADEAAEFRHERGLLSAEEMDAWLARRGLTAQEWLASMERSVLRRQWAGEIEEIARAFPVSDAEVAGTLWCDGLCSGELPRLARELAGRAAVYARLREEDPRADDPLSPQAPLSAGPLGDEGQPGLPPCPPDLPGALHGPPSRERLAHLACLDAALQRFSAAVLTPRAIRDQIGARYLEWIRLDCRVLAVPDEQVAREAAALVREDGLGLAEVAALARASVAEAQIYLDEVEPVLGEALRRATTGELVGPLPVGGAFQLLLVVDRATPSDGDPAICRRAEADLLARLLDREVASRVHWHGALAEGEP